jgi:HEAT repeat protein
MERQPASIAAACALFILSGCASQPSLPTDAPPAAESVQILQQLRSRKAQERADAAWRAGEMEADGAFAVPALIAMLGDRRSYYAGEDPVGHPLYSTPAEESMEALTRIGTAAVDGLIAASRDRRADVRERAVYALARIEDPRALDTLVRALKDRAASVRLTAATWIRQDDDRVLDALIQGLNDPDESVRWQMSKAIQAYVDDPRVVQPLVDALSNDSIDVQVYAMIALGAIRDPAITPKIVAVLDDESTYHSVRAHAALALGSRSDEDSFAALMRALGSPVWNARQGALQAMAARRDSRAVPRLIESLEDENMAERLLAARALGEIGDPRAIEPLQARLNDPQPAVREKVIAALQKIAEREPTP